MSDNNTSVDDKNKREAKKKSSVAKDSNDKSNNDAQEVTHNNGDKTEVRKSHNKSHKNDNTFMKRARNSISTGATTSTRHREVLLDKDTSIQRTQSDGDFKSKMKKKANELKFRLSIKKGSKPKVNHHGSDGNILESIRASEREEEEQREKEEENAKTQGVDFNLQKNSLASSSCSVPSAAGVIDSSSKTKSADDTTVQ
eukprot:Pgem_evm1s8616